ncbi:ABC transporter permease [Tepidibacter aestuarii]|uniref:ABC transporter permease n=1 Tax=Tepidibacter aestuarii TaxID=2925782 RepID=UPI0020BDFF9F|nr:ABC transporter permease [Tepidibacter aestuarii]CAH2214746.1 putative ABC transport system permease protein [Tepidibacter aestuarii]
MLLRKMMRDLWNQKGTYLASMILVILGILLYNMFSMLYESFSYSLDKYYKDYHFADGTLKVVGMPNHVVDDIIRIKEVKNATGRLEKRVRLLDKEREVIFQFISYDADKENRLNDIELLGGRMPNQNEREIIIGNNYFDAMKMELGDKLPVVVNGKRYNLTVVGYGRSPEFVYAKKNDNELISDPTSFDLTFMPYKSMCEMFDNVNQINNVAFSLYNEDEFETAKRKIKEVVYKYGIEEITSREDQISHATTTQEMDGIRSMTKTLPIMFLVISGVIIYIVLKRIIEQERTQIGVLKAFGISDFRILIHYISYSIIIGLIGGAIGFYIGISSVPSLIEMLGIGYNMPFVTAGLYKRYLVNSFILSLLFAIISGYAGAKNCLKLEPADAMRANVSVEGKEGLLDKFYWVIENLDIKIKMALRNIVRNKGRSLFILFGISITAALLCFPVAMSNMYDKMLMDQFTKIETYDMKISLNKYMDRKPIVRELKNKDGVTDVEPMMQFPVKIFNNWRSEEIIIISLPLNSKLYHLYDLNDDPVPLQADGMMLTHWMAKSLNIQEGDYVSLESPLFRNETMKKIKVTKIIPQYIGSNGYMNIDLVKELLDGRDAANALMVNGTKESLDKLKDDYDESEMIGTFDFREKIAAQFAEFMQQTTAMIGILVFFGLVTGFAVIYVSLTISLSERNRELATMLVVGMSEREVHQVLIIEQFIISIFGMALGVPLGKLLLVIFAETSSTEHFIMPSTVPIEAMFFSIVLTTISIIIPQIFGRRKIGKIIVTEALNARE